MPLRIALALLPVLCTTSWLSAGPSDYFRYEVDAGGKREILRTHRHAWKADGYFPVTSTWEDLPAILGLSAPPGVAGTAGKFARTVSLLESMENRKHLRLFGELQLKAEYAQAGGVTTIRYRFATKANRDAVAKVSHGTATVEQTVADDSTIRGTRVTWKAEVTTREGKKELGGTWSARLTGERAHGKSGFQAAVDVAIDKGVVYLKTKQRPDGTYPPHREWDLGTAAFCAFTLSSCGVPRSDPAIEKTLAHLVRHTPRNGYDRAVSLMALDRAYAPAGELARAHRGQLKKFQRDLPPDRLEWCRATAKALEENAVTPGSWAYGRGDNRKWFDSSNTQYAVLGLRAAGHLGIATGERTWLGVLQHFRTLREATPLKGRIGLLRDGEAVSRGTVAKKRVSNGYGYRYRADYDHGSGSMTTAAIACMRIARHELERMKSSKIKGKLKKEIDAAVLGAWLWMDRHWSMARAPGHVPATYWHYYYLYSVERAAILDRVKRVGDRDWYFEGAAFLLDTQRESGSWGREDADPVTTCFALLFLKRATAPLTITR
ncbi:MAG: hypothetical protein V3T86_05155 [Planctomycetota bacterium]